MRQQDFSDEPWIDVFFLELLNDVYPDYEYLLLDEVQNLSDWDVWVSKLYRRGKNLIITETKFIMHFQEIKKEILYQVSIRKVVIQ